MIPITAGEVVGEKREREFWREIETSVVCRMLGKSEKRKRGERVDIQLNSPQEEENVANLSIWVKKKKGGFK